MTMVALGYSLLGLMLLFFAAVWWGCSRFAYSESLYCRYAFSYTCSWALCVILLSLRGEIPDWLSYNLCIFLLLAGFVILLRSIEVFYSLKPSWLATRILILGSAFFLIFLGPNQEHQIYRLLLLGGVSAYCSIQALKKGLGPLYREHGPVATWFIGGIGVVVTLLWLLRVKFSQHMAPDELSLVQESDFNLTALYMVWLVAICFQGAMLFLLITRSARELDKLSTIDFLTGAQNRLGLNKSWGKIMPNNQPSALLILDVDHFKRINDSYGHDFGDVVLKRVVQRINRCIRNEDILSRYGGEEFVVLLPDSDLERGYGLAERIRLGIEQDPLEVDGKQLRVTVSIGVVSFHTRDCDIDSFISLADKALYRAKEQGRNQVVVAS